MSLYVTASSEEFSVGLNAAKVTAFKGKDDPVLSAVYLHTTRSENPHGPGETDSLVFTSYNGTSVGQLAINVTGTLDHPVLLDIADITAITSVIKTAQKKMRDAAGKEATLEVRLSLVTSEAGSESMLIQTITDGAPGTHDSSYAPVLNVNIDSYPIDDAMVYLSGVSVTSVKNNDGQELHEGAALVVSREQSTVMSGIQHVFGDENVYCYPLGHSANRRILTCGLWRGSVPGAFYGIDDDLDIPFNEVLIPPTSTIAPGEETLREKRTGERELAAATAHVETLT